MPGKLNVGTRSKSDSLGLVGAKVAFAWLNLGRGLNGRVTIAGAILYYAATVAGVLYYAVTVAGAVLHSAATATMYLTAHTACT